MAGIYDKVTSADSSMLLLRSKRIAFLQSLHQVQAMSDTVLFRFGLISDIQYADMEDASNFSGSEHRAYRASAGHAAQAIQHWCSLEYKPAFIAQLGDLIDGQNAGEYGQGLDLTEPESEQAFQEVMKAWWSCPIPTYHAVGNHELYNFSWERLSELLNGTHHGAEHHISDLEQDQFYFSWQPAKGWRIIMLNCYEISVIRPRSPENFTQAETFLRTYNPNYLKSPPYNYFEGLATEHLRYVPFNGGFGTHQLAWLQSKLDIAHLAGERVLVMGHLPIYPLAASPRNVAFDADEALSLIQNSECVIAYFAGHRHGGGYAQDGSGIHHVTVQAPLTHGYCAATIDIFTDRIQIRGEGTHRSYLLQHN